VIPWLKPWSPVFTCVRTGWMRTGSKKFEYWNPGEVKPLTRVKFASYWVP
jgi:hypothetical protein